MLLTPSTSHVPYDLIYEPAEDSFLFLDTLASASETVWLSSRFSATSRTNATSHPSKTRNSEDADKVPLVLEIGPGSGVIIAFLTANAHKILGRHIFALSVDLNPHAARATLETVEKAILNERETTAPTAEENSEMNRSLYLASLQGDLTSPLLAHQIDILIFNPPYVPTASLPLPLPPSSPSANPSKPTFEESSHLLELSYAGGHDGMETTSRLLNQIPDVLSERGVAYVLFCKGNRPEEVKEGVRQWRGPKKWKAETVGESGKKAGWERLEVVRIWREGG